MVLIVLNAGMVEHLVNSFFSGLSQIEHTADIPIMFLAGAGAEKSSDYSPAETYRELALVAATTMMRAKEGETDDKLGRLAVFVKKKHLALNRA